MANTPTTSATQPPLVDEHHLDNCEDFDWDKLASEDIVAKEQAKVAAYLNTDGDLVIRRRGHWDEIDDPFIVIGAAHVVTLVERVCKLFDLTTEPASTNPSGVHQQQLALPVPARRDRTAAQRQRRRRQRLRDDIASPVLAGDNSARG